MSKKFAIIGASGFVGPRHIKAIYDTGNKLLAAYDPSDSFGIIDTYFPEAEFFRDLKKFENFYNKIIKKNININYFTILGFKTK